MLPTRCKDVTLEALWERCDRIGNLTLALLGLECSHDVVPRDVALTCVPCDGGVAQRRPRQK